MIAISLLLAGCSAPDSKPSAVTLGGVAFHSMQWTVKLDVLPAGESAASATAELQKLLDHANDVLSTYQPDTELMRFNRAPVGAWVEVSPLLFDAVQRALIVSEASGGSYDITVGPLVNLWGFGPDVVPVKTPTSQQVEQVRARVGWEKLGIDPKQHALSRRGDVALDLSSIGEGVAVDVLSEQLQKWGVKGYMVSVAGCTHVRGTKANGAPWVIAIEKPDGSGQVQQLLTLSDQVISTSGSYRNYREIDGVRYSHTIDPVSGRPITHKGVSVSVVLDDNDGSALADAWATALNVLGPDAGFELAESRGLRAYFIWRDGSQLKARHTRAFQSVLPKP
ncbi:Thiamine biosynthesis lipoprotein [gamma proteobacterium HdN1]|nr:Thiamine biosynthesis lipoprotein [gamma proteobacterium HdN1]